MVEDNGWRTNTDTGGKFKLEWSYGDAFRSDRELSPEKVYNLDYLEQLGMDINLKGLSDDTQQVVARGIGKVLKDFPEFEPTLGGVKLKYNGRLKRAVARMTIRGNEWSIEISKEVQNENFDKHIKSAVDQGWWAPGTTKESIIAHEFSHSAINKLKDATDYDLRSEILESRIIKKAFQGTKYNAGHISRYAKTNCSETIAEAFSEYYGSAETREPARLIVEATKEVFRETLAEME